MDYQDRRPLRVLVACEFSGRVREAFRRRGHAALSCDLLPADDGSPHHYQGNVLDLLEGPDKWDMLIAFPPCTYLCSSGLHWNNKTPGRTEKTEAALDFVRLLMEAPVPHIAIENPVGCISTRIRKPTQYIQPYQYGHNASKKTGLWLTNLPALVPNPEHYIAPRLVGGRKRWANQTDSGQNRLAPSPSRAMERSKTYLGIAEAMACAWSEHVLRALTNA